MSLPPASQIYTGPWINWSRGFVLGSTITLSQRNGSLLTAFLGIFVTAAGTACWRILSFLIHQRQAKHLLNDAIHHQQQVILRNSGTPGEAAWQMTQLAWHWRKIAEKPRPILRSLPLVILAVCNMVLFAIAGVFSAEVTKAAGNETLIRSPACGFLLPNDRSDLPVFQSTAGANAMEANDTLAASAYSRACYGNTQSGSQCYQYSRPYIPWTNRTDMPCPFGDNICKDVGGFEMDSGLIDSHETLGINAKTSDRVQYRKVTTCSVLRTKEYAYEFNSTGSGTEVQHLIRYNYGTTVGSDENFTFQYNTNDVVGFNGYALTSFPFFHDQTDAVPALNRTDADITLMFLAPNTVTYVSPVFDPLFKATLPYNTTDFDGKNATLYTPDHWVGVLACADQFQFRNPASGKSTPLTSNSFISEELEKLEYNKLQQATALSVYYTVLTGFTYYSVHRQGANSLRASDTLGGSDFFQIGLPDNQWMIEAAGMFSLSMAKLQQQIVAYATGPTYLHEGLTFVKGDKDLCRRQKIRGVSGFLSFSVVGVSIILVLGGFLICAASILDTLVGFIRRKWDWKDHKRLQWAIDEKLQLQRLAFEEGGQGRWSGGTDAVPTTSKDELLGFKSGLNKNHPRLAGNGYSSVQPADELAESEASTMIAMVEKPKTPGVTTQETRQLLG
ncbi:MAG: hypothetical protein Q9201_001864 [Fulgogasparrea decipioides]